MIVFYCRYMILHGGLYLILRKNIHWELRIIWNLWVSRGKYIILGHIPAWEAIISYDRSSTPSIKSEDSFQLLLVPTLCHMNISVSKVTPYLLKTHSEFSHLTHSHSEDPAQNYSVKSYNIFKLLSMKYSSTNSRPNITIKRVNTGWFFRY